MYGGPPAPDLPLPLFWALTRRIPRFESRALLRLIQGVSAGAGELFAEPSLEASFAKDRLRRIAYPLKRTEPRAALIQTQVER